MSQMTEEAKKRMEELAYSYEAPTHRNCYGCCQSDSDYENAFKAGYLAGIQDPDANKELLDECEKGLQWMASTAIPLKKRNDAEYLRIMIEDVLIPKSDELLQKLKERGK